MARDGFLLEGETGGIHSVVISFFVVLKMDEAKQILSSRKINVFTSVVNCCFFIVAVAIYFNITAFLTGNQRFCRSVSIVPS